jgi:hypothetical protein
LDVHPTEGYSRAVGLAITWQVIESARPAPILGLVLEKEDPMAAHDATRLLRRALGVNCWITSANAVAFLAGGHLIAPVFGLPPAVLWVLGAGLLAFALHAGHVARKETITRGEATYFVAADVAYVVASVAVLVGFPGLMSGLGRLFFAAAADVVAILAVAEYVGLRRMTHEPARAAA